MKYTHSVSGMVCVRIESADPAEFFRELSKTSVVIYDICYVNELCASFWISHREYRCVSALAERKGVSLFTEKRTGVYWQVIHLIHRPVLLTGIGFLVFLSFFIPGRILFVSVEGNKNIPDRYILECAQTCGLVFGADRSLVRSERMKNAMLERIPQLQWIGVNTSGCVAVISVRERELAQNYDPQYAVSSIVADRDGVIVSCTGIKGNVLCKPGQAVKQGEVLISGYTDCGISIRAEQAEGDVYAQTMHSLTVISPIADRQIGDILHTEERYALIVGKNRINFYKDSGILPSGCDMIYEQYYAMLPGGFQLPVAIVKETWYTYDNTAISVSEDAVPDYAYHFARDYLCAQMVGGKILESEVSEEAAQGVYILNGKYTCLEMIGRVRREEILKGNG